jgi:hypothetical protein
MKFFYLPVLCIALFTLSYELKTRQEIICKESTSSSSVAFASIFDNAELSRRSPNHNIALTTVTYGNFLITVSAGLNDNNID